MSSDGSLVGAGTQFLFDLDSQEGVMHLLSSVRASTIPVAQKNELRDLIFLYANGGRDQSVRITLEQKVIQYRVPALPFKSKMSSQNLDFGTSRPSPSFHPPAVSPRPPVADKPVPTQAAPSIPQTPPTPQPVVTPPVSPVAPATPVAPPPTPNPPPPPIPEQPQPEPLSVSPSTSPVAEVPMNQDQALLRIKEIKSLVNEKVGNPVNLVDIDNAVGREYMSALLDAMKKVSAGSLPNTTMARLEAAYQAVEKTIAEHGGIAKAPAAPSQSAPAAPAVPTNSAPEPVNNLKSAPMQPATNFQPTPTPAESTIPTQPVSQPRPVAPSVQEDKINMEQPMPEFKPIINSSVPKTEPGPSLSSKPISPIKPEPVKPVSTPEVEIVAKKTDDSKPEPASTKVESVSGWGPATDTLGDKEKENLVKSKKESPVAKPEDKSEKIEDPLMSKEVDDGLDQLLSEWVLFKKSGFFGTGPKGREHPLFKKIANLQIPLLLAGRFEGATQEIKQSITDYMNGWRYEQGIIYQQGENFEHYLRRVIRHIIDLQNKK